MLGSEPTGWRSRLHRANPVAFWRRALGSPRMLLIRRLPAVGWSRLAVLGVLLLVQPVLNLAFLLASGRLVGGAAAAVGQGLSSPAGRTMVNAMAVLGAVFVAEVSLLGVREALAQAAGRRLDRHLRDRVLAASLEPHGVAHLEDATFLDQLAVTRAEETGVTPGLAASGLVQVAANRLAVVAPAGLLLSFRWWLPLAVGAALIAVRRAMGAHIMRSVNAAIGEMGTLRKASYLVDLALQPAAAKETRIFGLAGWLTDRYREHYLRAMATVWRDRSRGQLRLVLPIAASALASTLGYVVVVRSALRGEIDIERLAVLLSAMAGMRGILSLSNADVHLDKGAAVLPAIAEVERRSAEIARSAGGAPADGLPRHAVRFEGVRFRYPGSDHDVYDGLELEIRAGESLAIVGVNGAGKTTLVKLLARLYEPTEGRITVDGRDARELDAASWQRRVAAIFQDFTRYELPAVDNVAFGALHRSREEATVRRAVERAGAAAIVDGLPHGLATVLSRRFTGGTDLSGGEWQRVALARALMAVEGGASILVLDEPTANLDVRAEAEIYDRFLDLTRNVTTIVISHRFSTVRRADRIVVLDGGRVVEDGTHDALLAAGGHYARMFTLQASRFGDDTAAVPLG